METIKKIFIIGAPKCGTTSMAYYLGKHPNIFIHKIKEPHYFNKDLNHRYFYDFEKYNSLYNKLPKNTLYTCDASVWYLYSKVAIQQILNVYPNAYFIIMLREHSELFFSLHRELLYGGEENVKSPKRAWDLIKSRKRGKDIPKTTLEPKLLFYDETCAIGNLTKIASTLISRDKLKIIFLEELKKNADNVYLETLAWLSLKKISLSNYEIINSKKERKYFWITFFFRKILIIKKGLGINWGIGFANTINKFNKTKTIKENDSHYFLLKSKIKLFFKDDRRLLEKITKRDLSHWD